MPAPTPVWKGSGQVSLVEIPQSGEVNYGDVVTTTRIYEGSYTLCVSSAPAPGTLGSGSLAGYFVRNAKVTKDRGGKGQLVIIWELAGWAFATVPPQETNIEPFEINPRIERHQMFEILTSDQRAKIKAYLDGQNIVARDDHKYVIENFGENTEKANKLIDKLIRGMENYYLAGFKYSWSQYYTSLSSVSDGGYIEAPSGPLSSLASGLDLDWLRQADQVQVTNGLYKLTKSWLGAPTGHWDPDIYPV